MTLDEDTGQEPARGHFVDRVDDTLRTSFET